MSNFVFARSDVSAALEPPRVQTPPTGFDIDEVLRRALDILISLLGLFFLLPLLIVVAAIVKLQDGGPVLFYQHRVGRNGVHFRCWKFRTMVVDAQERLERHLAQDPQARIEWDKDHKLRSDPRITAIGRFLRKSSIDEIPQLLNVLAGEMSIVGPRPIVLGEVHRYGSRFACYCRVRPGITGLWQVSGRNNIRYRRRVAMDVAYIRNRSVLLDLKIIAATIPAVLQSRGSY